MKVRHAIAAVVCAAFVVVPVGVASADDPDYPPNAPTVQLLLNSAPCDANVGVTGANWQPGSTIELTLHSTPVNVGSAVANGSGSFSTSFVVPKGTDPGNHQLEANGKAPNGSVAAASTTLNVQNQNCATNQPSVNPPGGGTNSGGGATTTTPSTTNVTVQGVTVNNPNNPNNPSSPNNAGSGSGVGSQQTPTGKGGATQPATQVEGTQQTKPSGVLPLTGAAAVGILLLIGLGLILMGSTSVLAARRRVGSA